MFFNRCSSEAKIKRKSCTVAPLHLYVPNATPKHYTHQRADMSETNRIDSSLHEDLATGTTNVLNDTIDHMNTTNVDVPNNASINIMKKAILHTMNKSQSLNTRRIGPV